MDAMEKTIDLERKYLGKLTKSLTRLTKNVTLTLTDYKARHINISAASISFFAIFSLFPLLAFMVYLAAQLDAGSNQTAAKLVMSLLNDFIPGLQNWITKGLYSIIQGNTVVNWTNGLLLGWAGVGLFGAVEHVIHHLPHHEHHRERAHVVRFGMLLGTLALFSLFALILIASEQISGRGGKPEWFLSTPGFLQVILIAVAKSKFLAGLVGTFTVAAIYQMHLPIKLQWKNVLFGAAFFATLLILSHSAYHFYLAKTQETLQSTYGIFSSMVVVIIWTHFVSNCFVYCCLFAYHLDTEVFERQAEHGHKDNDQRQAA